MMLQVNTVPSVGIRLAVTVQRRFLRLMLSYRTPHWPTLSATSLTALCLVSGPSHMLACLCVLPTLFGLFDLVRLKKQENYGQVRMPAVNLPVVWKGP
ncbi:hypothetical protein E2C01_066667 [Portunus trituberculatus]|uniref:Uncharacterized protein n=1 Tax=Portunus trituberculatus TaxID=210409 RepID=A0A5B7HQE6_PORTR|nr:hypothetical protein [Portunus trituberculatus]